jgi:hypothetical protein
LKAPAASSSSARQADCARCRARIGGAGMPPREMSRRAVTRTPRTPACRPPSIALSVRQPSAWAIIHGGKDVENRSLGSIRAGRMVPGRIAIHAAIGMKRAEYEYLVWRWARDGVTVPRPDAPRRAIIGSVEVVRRSSPKATAMVRRGRGLCLCATRCPAIRSRPGRLGLFRMACGGAWPTPCLGCGAGAA